MHENMYLWTKFFGTNFLGMEIEEIILALLSNYSSGLGTPDMGIPKLTLFL